MNLLSQSAFLNALGWSLISSLWQFAVLWLLYTMLTASGKKFEARTRHSLGLLTLLAGNAWFIITFISNYFKALESPTVLYLSGNEVLAATGLAKFAATFEPVLPYLSFLYLVAVLVLLARFYAQYRFTRKIAHTGLYKVGPQLRAFVKQVSTQLGIKKNISTWLSDKIDTPLTIGFFKPIILLPVAAISHLSIEQAEAVLLHELQHIRRNDFFINMAIAFNDILLFFNPFARLLSGVLAKERENSCDDTVLQFQYNPATYAKALLLLEQNRRKCTALALAVTGKNKQLLLHRVKRILQCKPQPSPLNYRLGGFLFAAVLLGSLSFLRPAKIVVESIGANAAFATRVPYTEKLQTFRISVNHARDLRTQPVPNTAVSNSTPVSKQTADLIAAAENLVALVALQQEDDAPETTVDYASTETPVAFSMNEESSPEESPVTAGTEPYVPSSSFEFQTLPDTSKPRMYNLNNAQLRAREDMEKALKALQEIDWTKLQQELNDKGAQVSIVQLQDELRKAVQEVNWEKISDGAARLRDAQLELNAQAYELQLKKFQEQRKLKLDNKKILQGKILQERISECPGAELGPVIQLVEKIKKIVVI